MSPTSSDIFLYQSPDGQIQLDVQLDHDTVWLTQAQISELFETTKQNISLHIRNLFKEQDFAISGSGQGFLDHCR